MKQKKTMLIMVAVLAVLLVLYGGLKAWNSHSDRQKKAKEDKRRQRKSQSGRCKESEVICL